MLLKLLNLLVGTLLRTVRFNGLPVLALTREIPLYGELKADCETTTLGLERVDKGRFETTVRECSNAATACRLPSAASEFRELESDLLRVSIA